MSGRHLNYDERKKEREDRQKKLQQELEQMEREQEERKKRRHQQLGISTTSTFTSTSRERERERERERDRERERREEREKQKEKDRQQWEKEQHEKQLAQQKDEEKRKKIVEQRVTRSERSAVRDLEVRKKEIQQWEIQATMEGDRRVEERRRQRDELQRQRQEEDRRFEEEREKRRLEREQKRREEEEQEQRQRSQRLVQRREERDRAEKERIDLEKEKRSNIRTNRGTKEPEVSHHHGPGKGRSVSSNKIEIPLELQPDQPPPRPKINKLTAPARTGGGSTGGGHHYNDRIRSATLPLPVEDPLTIIGPAHSHHRLHSSKEMTRRTSVDKFQTSSVPPTRSAERTRDPSPPQHIRHNRSMSNADAARTAVEKLQRGESLKRIGRVPVIVEDPTRKIKEVEQPTHTVLEYVDLELPTEGMDYESLREHFLRQGRLSRQCVLTLLTKSEEILKKEPNILHLSAPLTVVGDIHGQFFDLCNLFKIAGDPDLNKYLFLGDYVDRGFFSFECMTYLLTLKVSNPDRIFLIRGNHETRAMTEMHSFKDEILHKYDNAIYMSFMRVFDCLPLAAIVSNMQGNWFCCHGGLSPLLLSMSDLENINRFIEPEDETIMMDLLWGDPLEEDSTVQRFKENYKRDCGYCFGYDALSDFLEANKLVGIVRAHEVKQDGYEEHWYKKINPELKTPPCITVFSAPNYCDTYANSGAYLKMDLEFYTFHQFAWVDHPYVLPKFQNGFAFSLPFILENAMQVLVKTMQVMATVGDDDEKEEEKTKHGVEKKWDVPLDSRLRVATAKMLSLKNLRESNSQAIQKLTLNGSITSFGRSMSLGAVVSKKKTWFEAVKEIDEENEKLVFENPAAMANQKRLRRTQTFKF